jgi:hypothetical protein
MKYDPRKKVLCIFIIMVLCGVVNSQSEQAREILVDWDKVKHRFSSFFEYPSPENAESLMKLLPASEVSKEIGDRSGAMESAMADYTILETEVLAGNRYAADVLFRLLSLSDGALTMDIMETMGLLIRVKPKYFLDLVLKYQEGPFFKEEYPVYAVGPAYREKKRARIYEYEMRIEALESVSGSKYTEVIGECVRELRTMIFKLSL